MIFTLRSNQARVERAEKAGEAAAEERAKVAVAALQLAWESWNERRLAAARDGRPFTEPPPGTTSGMNGNGGMNGSASA